MISGPEGYRTVEGAACYWVVLPTEVGAAPSSSWIYRFEESLPFPHEHLQCAFTRLPDGRILGAGLSCEQLTHLINTPALNTAWCLHPLSIPPGICDPPPDPNALIALNFLGGRFVATPLQKAQRIVLGIALGSCVLASFLLLASGWWLARQHQAAEHQLLQRKKELTKKALEGSSANPHLPLEAQLLQAYRALPTANAGSPTCNILGIAEKALSGLPASVPFTFRDLQANQRQIVVHATFAGQVDVTALGAAANATGDNGQVWRIEPTDLRRDAGPETLLTLVWRPLNDEVRR